MGKDQGIYIYPHDLAVLSRRLEAFKFDSVDCCYNCIHLGGGIGVLRIMAYTGRLQVYERVQPTSPGDEVGKGRDFSS